MTRIEDIWHVGYANGLNGRTWLKVVALLRAALGGRFLTGLERQELASGWKCGRRDIAEYRRDMQMADPVA